MKKLSLIVAPALLPGAALAHAGDHAHASPLHLLTQPDHLIGIGAVLALVALGWWLARRGRP